MVRLLSAFFLLMVGCATKHVSQDSENSSGREVSDVGSSSSAPSPSSKPMKYYFSELQILVQTNPLNDCSQAKKLEGGRSDNFSVEISPEGRFVRKLGPKTVQYYALNVRFQKMGFDEVQYAFSVLDGVVPDWAPHNLRIRRRPGNFIDVYYLSEVFTLQLSQSQVYSFKTVEKRGSCELEHDINIFAENSGFYLPVEEESVSLGQ